MPGKIHPKLTNHSSEILVPSTAPPPKAGKPPSGRKFPLSEEVVVSSGSDDNDYGDEEDDDDDMEDEDEGTVTAKGVGKALGTSVKGNGQKLRTKSTLSPEGQRRKKFKPSIEADEGSAAENDDSTSRVSDSVEVGSASVRGHSETGSLSESGSEGGHEEAKRSDERESVIQSPGNHAPITPQSLQKLRRQPEPAAAPRPYTAPPGFQPLTISSSSSSPDVIRSLLTDENALSSSQIWHITVPSSLPLDAIPLPSTISLADLEAGNPILTHEGTAYCFVEGVTGESAETVMLAPSKDGYSAVHKPVAATYHMMAVQSPERDRGVNVRDGLDREADQARSQKRGTSRRKREQPPGLKMRCLPIGFGTGDPGRIGWSDSDDIEEDVGIIDGPRSESPQFRMPKLLKHDNLKTVQTADSSHAPSKRKHKVLDNHESGPNSIPQRTPSKKRHRKDKEEHIGAQDTQDLNSSGQSGMTDTATLLSSSLPQAGRISNQPPNPTDSEQMVPDDEERRLRKEQKRRRREEKERRKQAKGKGEGKGKKVSS